jgi:DNA polymerase-1
VISWDLESFRFRRPILAPRPVCLQWTDRYPTGQYDAQIVKFRDGDARDWIEAWLLGDELLTGHGLSYDILVLMEHAPELIPILFKALNDGRIECTLLRQKLIDIAHGELEHRKTKGFNLGEVARRYDWEVDKLDPWRTHYGELDPVPLSDWPEDAIKYALADGPPPYVVFEGQKIECEKWTAEYGSPILHQSPYRLRYDVALRLAQTWGVRTDRSRTQMVADFTNREIERMKEELQRETRAVEVKKIRSKNKVKYEEITIQKLPLVRKDGSKNTSVVKTIVEELFTKRGEEAPLTKAGETSTEKDTMILAGAMWPAGSEERRLSEVLITYADYTSANNLSNRVEDLQQGFDLPLQPKYDSLLETGRTSSSKGTKKGEEITPETIRGIQIQNFPRGFDKRQVALWKEMFPGMPIIGARECLVPREGCVFVLADYSGAELHALAQNHFWMFKQSALMDILNSGIDLLLSFGCQAYGEGQRYEELPKGAKDMQPFKAWRQASKPIVYGRPGGMGAKKIVITARKSYNVILDLVEAKRLVKLYDDFVPELKRQFDYVSGLLAGKKSGVLRQLGSGRWSGGRGYSAMNNSLFQGLTADGALEALWAVVVECYSVPSSALYGYRPIAFVHDEIVLEGPEDTAHDAAMRLQHVMEEQMNRYTPDCPTPAEPLVTRIWSKDAKPVFAADGKLVPWDLKWNKEEERKAA